MRKVPLTVIISIPCFLLFLIFQSCVSTRTTVPTKDTVTPTSTRYIATSTPTYTALKLDAEGVIKRYGVAYENRLIQAYAPLGTGTPFVFATPARAVFSDSTGTYRFYNLIPSKGPTGIWRIEYDDTRFSAYDCHSCFAKAGVEGTVNGTTPAIFPDMDVFAYGMNLDSCLPLNNSTFTASAVNSSNPIIFSWLSYGSCPAGTPTPTLSVISYEVILVYIDPIDQPTGIAKILLAPSFATTIQWDGTCDWPEGNPGNLASVVQAAWKMRYYIKIYFSNASFGYLYSYTTLPNNGFGGILLNFM